MSTGIRVLPKMRILKDKTKATKAFVDVDFHGMILKSIKVIEGKDGYFIKTGSSQQRDKDGKPVMKLDEESGQMVQQWDVHYQIPKDNTVLLNELTRAVLSAYNAEIESQKAMGNK